MQKNKTLLIIDGNALVHRAYHALPDFKTSTGIPTNALYGFISILHKTIIDLAPTHVLVCFDAPGKTFRDDLYTEYRAQRPEPDIKLISQFPLICEFLKQAGITHISQRGYEADDLIATVVRIARRKDMKSIILTGDKDLFQIVSSRTFVLTPSIGYSKGHLYDSDEVYKKFGVFPKQIADYKALAGDPSDNYKGVKGIGPKTACNLINTFGSIEKIYKCIDEIEKRMSVKLLAEKDYALLSKKLARLVDTLTLPIMLEDTLFTKYNESVSDFFDTYQFRSLKERLLGKKYTTRVKDEKTTNQPKLF